jgi:hypothetical protein
VVKTANTSSRQASFGHNESMELVGPPVPECSNCHEPRAGGIFSDDEDVYLCPKCMGSMLSTLGSWPRSILIGRQLAAKASTAVNHLHNRRTGSSTPSNETTEPASDYRTNRDIFHRDSAEDEVGLARHSFAKGSVVDTLDPLHCVADRYLRRITEDAQVFIRVLDENHDDVVCIGAAGTRIRDPALPAFVSHQSEFYYIPKTLLRTFRYADQLRPSPAKWVTMINNGCRRTKGPQSLKRQAGRAYGIGAGPGAGV